MEYDHKKIEKRWQKTWKEEGVYEPDLDNPNNPFYNLMMFPYPSAEGLHVGNMYAFTGSDVYGRFKRMQENDVFEPIGLDGFGIHSENYAMKVGTHPVDQSKKSESNFYKQLRRTGNGFAWNEKLETYKPDYYRWTQWLFVQMYKNGLAYRKTAPVNWCPGCKTVLADEQVISGECERCESEVVQKNLSQWFFKITDYADRLLDDIDNLDWSKRVKTAQKNWIGKSKGSLINFKITGSDINKKEIEVFTTRPDTLLGATYMVLAPEHKLVEDLLESNDIKNKKEVKKYIKEAKHKTEQERKQEAGEKTGVEIKGVKALNPATKEEIPIWIADYVLASYGTGAIMAVPAHDDRDYEFAQKFNLPVKQVVAPHVVDDVNPPKEGAENTTRDMLHCIVKHPDEDKILSLEWKKQDWQTFITGGIEEGEEPVKAGIREIKEETGYKDIKFIKKMPFIIRADFHAAHKNVNREINAHVLLFQLESLDQDKIDPKETEKHEPKWIPSNKVRGLSPVSELDYIVRWLEEGDYVYTDEGELINSGEFAGLSSSEAKNKITQFVNGKDHTNYQLRDWLISRQRYWGPPIPIVYCRNCFKGKSKNNLNQGVDYDTIDGKDYMIHPVPEKDLPVKLPHIEDFRPKGKGKSPLATDEDFYKTECPECGNKAIRETDVSDTFLDSSWYYFRYIDKENDKEAFSKKRVKNWLPVDMYIGGAEHSVLHLLYTRFVTKAFYDWNLIDFEEPFNKFRAHGLLIKEGSKMSKSKGNVINPDEYIDKFGADVLRTYLMFLAPFEEGGDFRDEGIIGITRFLDKVWRLFTENDARDESNENLLKIQHKSIKKISEDIENLKYNTAISQLMIFLDAMREYKENISKETLETFLKLLSPFAPHLTEELWRENLDNDKSIHLSRWPKFNSEMIKEENFKLIVQVNGKVRDTIKAEKGVSKNEAKSLVEDSEKVKKYLKDKEIKKVVYVEDKLINFVV